MRRWDTAATHWFLLTKYKKMNLQAIQIKFCNVCSGCKIEKYTFILIILPRLKRFKLLSKASTLLEQVLEVTKMGVKYVRRFQYTSTTTTICQRLSVSPSWCSNSWNDWNKPPLLLFFWNVFTVRWRGAYRWHSQVVDTLGWKYKLQNTSPLIQHGRRIPARSVSLPRYKLKVSGYPRHRARWRRTTCSPHSYKGMYGKY